jgi:hypothetical protein
MPASELDLNKAPPVAKEYKVVALRECPLPESLRVCENPDQAADYWRLNVATNPYFNPECECFVVLLLNTRRRVKGHHLIRMSFLAVQTRIESILISPAQGIRLVSSCRMFPTYGDLPILKSCRYVCHPEA